MGTIHIEGSDGAPNTDYRITVDGDAQEGSDTGGGDDVSDSGVITGGVGAGADTYSYTGTVVSASIPSHATLYVDGQPVGPGDLPMGGGAGSSYTPPGGSGSSSGGSTPTQTPTTPAPTTDSTPAQTPMTPAPATAGLGGNTTLLAGAAALALVAVYMIQS
ncbi:hypothetical protein [Haloarcula sp. CBA1129]|uniref:hypothetical protein n=1 Tax=Haloarcula sp. CBA1129 TaxID=1853684 RepID=UPI0012480C99|nr:hypothetical protein [Haloarcula sp. CBA1129]KAA9399683.1 hypothetical protein Har1129_16240 [Haloarcula sp. CBA1129]